MAQFKISLLNTTSEGSSVRFLENVISDFTSQEDLYNQNKINDNPLEKKVNHCYTYNEKLKLSANAQKELTFSMDEKLLIHDNWTNNPYTNTIHIGSLIYLVDQYGNDHIFTVKDIGFTIKELNTTYNYTCQDTFTYQLIRQNSGYTIENDSSAETFIGAQNIDYWAVKIKDECYVPYTYLFLNQGLYLNTNGQYIVYSSGDNLTSVEKIIKTPYNSDINPDYFESFVFSCSSSNGDAALIAAAESVGLALRVKECKNINSNSNYDSFSRFFWFEPNKNPDVSGISYSPKNNINNFNFSFKGDSLTTVLNVNSSTNSANEEVTLIPTIPSFFSNLFTSEYWKTSRYYDGYFEDIINGDKLIGENGSADNQIDINPTGTIKTKIYKKRAIDITRGPIYRKDGSITNYFKRSGPSCYDISYMSDTSRYSVGNGIFRGKLLEQNSTIFSTEPCEFIFEDDPILFDNGPAALNKLSKIPDAIGTQANGVLNINRTDVIDKDITQSEIRSFLSDASCTLSEAPSALIGTLANTWVVPFPMYYITNHGSTSLVNERLYIGNDYGIVDYNIDTTEEYNINWDDSRNIHYNWKGYKGTVTVDGQHPTYADCIVFYVWLRLYNDTTKIIPIGAPYYQDREGINSNLYIRDDTQTPSVYSSFDIKSISTLKQRQLIYGSYPIWKQTNNTINTNNEYYYYLDSNQYEQVETDIDTMAPYYAITTKSYVAYQIKNHGSNTLSVPIYYNRFNFLWDNTHFTKLFTQNEEYNARNKNLLLLIDDGDDTIVYHTEDEIDSKYINASWTAYIGFESSLSSAPQLEDYNVYLNWYRNFDENEKEFATAADVCPWLENKLIDFTYFLEQNIISKNEYETIMDYLKNNIRIINGQLMAYAKEYYQALHTQVQVLADITNKVDTIGAAFSADYTSYYANYGKISNETKSFKEAYNEFIQPIENKTPLYAHADNLASYFTKYFNAEQRFLKNIYNFRKFFFTRCSMEGSLYKDTLTISNDSANLYFLSFKSSHTYTVIPSNFSAYDTTSLCTHKTIYHKTANSAYTKADLINATNYTDYYVPGVAANTFTHVTDEFAYNKNNTYYITKSKYQYYFGNTIPTYKEILTINSIEYVPLTLSEIGKIYCHEHPYRYYIRDTKRYVPLDYIRWNYYQIRGFWNLLAVPALDQSIESYDAHKLVTYYKAYYPLTEIYYYGQKLSKSTTNNHISFTRINNLGINQTEYNNNNRGINPANYYEYQSIPFVGGRTTNIASLFNFNIEDDTTDVVINSYDNLAASNNSTSSSSASFYAFQRGAWSRRILGAEIVKLATGLIPALGILETASSIFAWCVFGCAAEWSCDWIQNGNTIRAFTTKAGNLKLKHQKLHRKNYDEVKSGSWSKYDSWYANYGRSSDASLESMMYIKTLADADSETSVANYGDIKIVTSTNNQHYGYNKYWQYATYYSKLAATYSFEMFYDNDSSLFGYTNPYPKETQQYSSIYNHMYPFKLFAKNKYLRIIGPSDYVNTNDTYYLLPIAGPSRNLSETEDKENEDEDYVYPFINSSFSFMPKPISNPDARYTNLSLYNKYGRISAYAVYWLMQTASKFSMSNINKSDLIEDKYILATDLLELAFDGLEVTNKMRFVPLSEDKYSYYFNSTNIPQFKYIKVNGQQQVVSDRWFKTSYPFLTTGDDILYLLVHVEDYERGIIDNNLQRADNISYDNPELYFLNIRGVTDNIYSVENDCLVNFGKINDLLNIQEGGQSIFYYIPNEDTNFVKITKDVWETGDSNKYYQKVGENFERIYTITQLLSATYASIRTEYYTLNNDTLEITTIDRDKLSFDTHIYLSKLIALESGGNKIETLDLGLKTLTFDDFETESFTFTDDEGNEYTCNITLEQDDDSEDLSAMTNGEFWYKHHEDIDKPILFEHAAMIETELSSYWTVAYTASLNCRFFLPSAWQITTDGQTNYYGAMIWKFIYNNNEGNPVLDRIELNPKIIPEVKIYSIQNEFGQEISWLPDYKFKFNTDSEPIETTEKQKIYKEQYAVLNNIPTLRENLALLTILKHFNYSDLDNSSLLKEWSASEYGKRIYYYVNEGSGLEWKNVAQELGDNEVFEQFDGSYGMIYSVLKKKYSERPISTYEDLLENKLGKWAELYKRYPGIFLESSFKNKDATTSSELLKSAQLAFKDQREPERSYSITLINSKYLNGYRGEELHIGDGILIKANEYHDKPDLIYKALNQYLFISDLSYTLRDDSQFNITVNSIKYQEKLLQSLVKLIR